MALEIKHDTEDQKFYTTVDRHKAFLDYKKLDDHLLDYRHTFVPRALRGRGIASQIVEHALNYARENNYKIIPTCSYVDRYVSKHAEHQDLVSD